MYMRYSMNSDNYKNYTLGLCTSLAAYVLWGLLPLYWAMLSKLDSNSILAQRVIWTALFVLVLVLITQSKKFINDIFQLWKEKKRILLLVIASLLISINWLVYIWAVNSNHVLDTSIGYYMTPLLNVLLGRVIFNEYIITAKKISVCIAAMGIVILTIQLGTFPWISIALAASFALYGAAKKQLQLNPFSSIALESILISPLALYYLLCVNPLSWTYYSSSTIDIALLLIGTGLITAAPMILFSFGANHLPLNLLGFLQYISPSIALVLAIFYFQESFDWPQLLAISCIWISLVIFSMSERFIITKK